jgi:hypothetical protein
MDALAFAPACALLRWCSSRISAERVAGMWTVACSLVDQVYETMAGHCLTAALSGAADLKEKRGQDAIVGHSARRSR